MRIDFGNRGVYGSRSMLGSVSGITLTRNINVRVAITTSLQSVVYLGQGPVDGYDSGDQVIRPSSTNYMILRKTTRKKYPKHTYGGRKKF